MSSIRYQLVEPCQFQEALTIYHECFLSQEPVTKALGYQRHPLTDKHVLSTLEANQSWCAIHEETGEMVGLRTCKGNDLDSLPHIDSKGFDDYIAKGLPSEIAHLVVVVRGVLDQRQLLAERNEQKVFTMNALGVRNDFQRRGIATELTKRAVNYGAELGYPLCTSICTSYYTQRLFEKLGFQRVKEAKFADYIYNGEAILKDVEKPHKSVISYVKEL